MSDIELLQCRALQIIAARRRHNASGQAGEDMANILAALIAKSSAESHSESAQFEMFA